MIPPRKRGSAIDRSRKSVKRKMASSRTVWPEWMILSITPSSGPGSMTRAMRGATI